MAGEAVKLRESLTLPGDIGERLDAAAGVVRGVKVLGLKSQNGRTYTPAAIKAAIPLIEGARVFIDHPDGESNARKYGERFGRLREARVDTTGEAWADLHYNPHHKEAASFAHWVQHDPAQLGLSINGDGVARRVNGVKLVEQITAIHSVDIVDGPATVGGLFEQTGATNMDPTTPAVDPMAPPAGDTGASGEGDFRAKLADLAQHVVSDTTMSNGDILTKLKQIVAMIEEAAPTEGDDAEPAEGDEEAEVKAMEQLQRFASPVVKWAAKRIGVQLRESRRAKLRTAAKTAGVSDAAITDTFLDTLLESAPAKRDALIADRKAVAGSGPRTTPRTDPTPAKVKTTQELAAGYFADLSEY